MAINKVIYYLIPLIFLVFAALMIFGPDKLFAGVKDSVDTIQEYAPDVNVGMNKLNAEAPSIPEEHRQAVINLIQSIKDLRDSPNTNCFANYGGFTKLGEKGTSLNFQWDPNTQKTYLTASGGAGGKQEVYYEEIENVRPCVIAWGYNNQAPVATTFHARFIEKMINEESKGSYYFRADNINIFDTSNWDTVDSGVKLVHNGRSDNYQYNLEDDGWLFKPDEDGTFCFLPTVSKALEVGKQAYNYKKCYSTGNNGLSPYCFYSDGSDSLQKKIGGNDLKLCSTPSYKFVEAEFGEMFAKAFPESFYGANIVNVCLDGQACWYHDKNSCNYLKEWPDMYEKVGTDCLLLLNFRKANKGCAYLGISPGSKILTSLDQTELIYGSNAKGWLGENKGEWESQVTSHPDFKVTVDSYSGSLVCGDDGLWHNLYGLQENCSDGKDNDFNGKVDCADKSCDGKLALTSSEGVGDYTTEFKYYCELSENNCADGFDNDNDGLIDCKETSCNGKSCGSDKVCHNYGCKTTIEINEGDEKGYPLNYNNCFDGIDNDNDGLIDCKDNNDCSVLTYNNDHTLYCDHNEEVAEKEPIAINVGFVT